MECTIMTIYDRCCQVWQFFEAGGSCTYISWIWVEIPSYILQRNVETGLSYDTVWYIMHKQLPATYRRKKKSNEKSSFDTLPYKSLSYRNQIREMDFSAGLRRRLSRTVRTLEGARIAPGNFKNRLAGKHMATRQHLGWILCRALLP